MKNEFLLDWVNAEWDSPYAHSNTRIFTFFMTFRRFSQFVKRRSATSTQDTPIAYPSRITPPPPARHFFQPQNKPNICVVTNEAKGHRELALIGAIPSLGGREGLIRRAFYYEKSGKGNPFLLLQRQLLGFWPRVRARALRAPVFLGAFTPQTGRYAPPRHPSHTSSQNKK